MTATQAQALDAKMVNAISSSVMEVLSSMANTNVTLKSVNARTDYTPIGDISAIIGIMGESGEGMVGLCFNSPLAKMMVARLLGIEPADLSDDDCCDGIGELVNMISGRSKTALSENTGQPFRMSLPTIIKGKGHEIASRPKNTPYLLMFFDAEGQEFVLQVSFKFSN
ncbi:MAG: chemotaxis protein CheX [Vampirovibrionales bacterium]|nr:chemotaxis protein CheX [Vampirovibrionales bacterium]